MPGPHDLFFKQTFSVKENAADFARYVLSDDIVSKIDFSTLMLENGSYIDEQLAEHFSDMVYSCEYGQSKIFISLLLEHKSSPDRYLPLQLINYMSGIWGSNIKQDQLFTPVIPIILYHGKPTWHPGKLTSCFNELPSELTTFVPNFDYVFVNLSNYSEQEIKETLFTQATLKISLLILKNIFHPDKLERALAEYFKIGEAYFREEKSLKFIEAVIRYVYQTTEIQTEKVVNAIAPLSIKGAEIAMTTAERLREEGMQIGTYESYLQFITNLRKENRTDEEIARLTGLDVVTVRKVANREKVEIPLHLLNRSS